MQAVNVIKRRGERASERFNPDKLHASVRAACLSVRAPEGEAEKTAQNVCQEIVAWLATKPEVTSNDLRRKAADTLAIFHPEAAYLYKHHQMMI